jgi:hypothetical protein
MATLDPSQTRTTTSAPDSTAEDDLSVATPTQGVRTAPKTDEMVEMTLRFDLKSKDPNAARLLSHAHTAILAAMQEGLDTGLRIYSNNSKLLTKIPVLQWTASLEHSKHFKITSKPAGKSKLTTYSIIHRVLSKHTFKDIKHLSSVMQTLRENNIQLKLHRWSEDQVHIQQPLFFLGLSPTAYTDDEANKRFLKLFTHAGRKHLPKYKLVMTKISMNQGDRKASALVYAIEVLHEDVKQLRKATKEVLELGNTDLLPAVLRYSHPDAFFNGIRKQMQSLSTQYVIPLLHVSDDIMFRIDQPLLAIDGVLDISPTKTANSDGRFNIIVKKSGFDQTRKAISDSLPRLMEDYIPPGISKQPFGETPSIRNYRDDESSEQSYMTASIQSFTSLAWSDVSEDQEPPVKEVNKTYASVAANTADESPLTQSSEIASLIKRLDDQQQQHRQDMEEMRRQHQEAIQFMQSQMQSQQTQMFTMFQKFFTQATPMEDHLESPHRKRLDTKPSPIKPPETNFHQSE